MLHVGQEDGDDGGAVLGLIDGPAQNDSPMSEIVAAQDTRAFGQIGDNRLAFWCTVGVRPGADLALLELALDVAYLPVGIGVDTK